MAMIIISLTQDLKTAVHKQIVYIKEKEKIISYMPKGETRCFPAVLWISINNQPK